MKDAPEGDTATKTVTYDDMLSSASDKLKETEEFSSCMKQNVMMCSQSAAVQIAQKTKSTEFCQELPSPEQKESCSFGIILTNAQEKSDITLCDSLSEQYKTQCKIEFYRSDAQKTKNKSTCSKIRTVTSGEVGAMNVTEIEEQCIMSIMMTDESTDEKDCDAFKEQINKDMCKMTVKNREEMKKLK